MSTTLNVLLLGSGGREHALALKISESPLLASLHIAPGNPGTATLGRNASLDILNGTEVRDYARAHAIDLVVVGPEAPLAVGVADTLRAAGLAVVGPGLDGAVLESSKDWSKRFMHRHGVPTAAYRSFDARERQAALDYVSQHSLPVVVKASGLAAGKGVVICADHAEARAAVAEMLETRAFGEAGDTIVVEQFLTGIEVSVFVLTDGSEYVLLPEAKDYKRIGAGDTGPNTGGMGAVSPVPFAQGAWMEKVRSRIIGPTIAGLKSEGIDYRGFIFFGLINVEGEPHVIEYNARMGDPETEAVMPRIAGDLLPVLWATAQGKLQGHALEQHPHHAVTVVLVSGGYPGAYAKGKAIALKAAPDAGILYHAGTALGLDGGLVSSGGRVLAATGLGPSLAQARANAYGVAATAHFEGMAMRPDIAQDIIAMG